MALGSNNHHHSIVKSPYDISSDGDDDARTSKSESAPGLLVLVVDLTNGWKDSDEDSVSFSQLISSLSIFLHAYCLMHRHNRLAVIGATSSKSIWLFPSGAKSSSSAAARSGIVEQFSTVDAEITLKLKELLKSTTTTTSTSSSKIAAGLSRALCFIERVLREESDNSTTSDKRTLCPRVLILQASEDASVDYVSMMNCIFSAQKQNIPIDGCMLSSTRDSPYLTQATALTKGIYLRSLPNASASFLQTLMTIWLPSADTRKLLALPTAQNVDFRAVCFCHQKVISIAFICPICLSCFCEFSPVCNTCGVRSYINAPTTTK